MKKLYLLAALLFCTAWQPRGGEPIGVPIIPPPPASSEACDTGATYPDYTKVCAKYQNGQTFVTWPDADIEAAGGNYRYRMYRSLSALNSGNCTAGTLIASYIFNNSGQLPGGNPNAIGDNGFEQAYRQNATKPMVKLTDLGAELPAFTGVQIYTAKATQSAYYCIVSTTTTDGSPSYIGAVGPIEESVATPQAIKWADSLSRGQTYGKITIGSGLPVVFKGHQSGAGSGSASVQAQYGDYWEMWMTAAEESWQDGRAVAFDVLQDNAQHAPSLTNSLEFIHRDTIVDPLGALGMEQYHIGLGMTPNPLVGPANRYYLTGCRQLAREWNFLNTHYSTDLNQLHWKGTSMGAWGGASCGIRGLALVGGPQLSALWLDKPVWRHDLRDTGNIPGKLWATTFPFKATIGTAPSTLGTVPSAMVLRNGGVESPFGGTGGYADMPAFIAANPGTDLPFTAWVIGKYDPYPVSFLEQLQAKDAFQSARRGHAFCWATMAHESGGSPEGLINRDAGSPDTTIAYTKPKFKLNLAYPAFSYSSIDDDPGTNTPTTNGLLDGDYAGCIGAGFTWAITADTSSAFSLTVGNPWMGRSPTVNPSTTTTGTMAASGTGTVTVASTAGWLATGAHPYVLVGDTPATQEIIKITSTAGNVLTFSIRGLFGTTAQAHASGVAVTQISTRPTGPNGGPYSTMTTDIAFRRMQGGLVPSACTVTPFGGSPGAGSLSFLDGIPVLTGVIINSGGSTSIACS